jgi:hypothetical protein
MSDTVTSPIGAVVVFGGLSLLRCFTDSNISVTVVDSDPESLTQHSKYARNQQMIACTRLQPEQAVADLIALGKRFDTPPMLTFDNEPMLLLASRNRLALSDYYRILLPDSELVEDLTCKLRFAALAERLRYLIEHPDVWPTLGRTGRGIVEERFNRLVQVATLETYHDELAGEEAGATDGSLGAGDDLPAEETA